MESYRAETLCHFLLYISIYNLYVCLWYKCIIPPPPALFPCLEQVYTGFSSHLPPTDMANGRCGNVANITNDPLKPVSTGLFRPFRAFSHLILAYDTNGYSYIIFKNLTLLDSVTFLPSPIFLTYFLPSFYGLPSIKFLNSDTLRDPIPGSHLFSKSLCIFFHLLPWPQPPPCVPTFRPPIYF